MSPQSTKPSDALATNRTPISTPSSNTRKRPIPLIHNASADERAAKKDLSAIMADVERYNKRYKHDHLILQSTQAIDPILITGNDVILRSANQASCGAEGEREGERDHPPDLAIQAPQHRQEQRMPPRPSLTSTQASSLSTPESQNLTIFSPKEKNLDAQSEYSHTTAQSNYTNYRVYTTHRVDGKACKTCVDRLTTGFPSSWKNHFWTKHCKRQGYYCFFCKVNILENEKAGTVSWQCKRCLEVFEQDLQAVVHFTNRDVPCYDRSAIFTREKAFRDHLQSKHTRVEILNGSAGRITCNLCQDAFTEWSQSTKHKCSKTAGWKYSMTMPMNVICDDHPDLVLETEKQVNEHFENEHFKNRQRKSFNGGSTLGDDDSRHDAYSVDDNVHEANQQQHHGHLLPGPVAPKALYSSQTEAENQFEGIGANPTVVLPEHVVEQNPTMEGDTGTSPSKPQRTISLPPSRTNSSDEDPPFLEDVITDGGKPSFLTRPNIPP